MAPRCVVIVDPYSTGCLGAYEAQKRGYKVIALWTKEVNAELKAHRPCTCTELVYYGEITESGSTEDVAAAVRAAVGENELCACWVGGESGVTLADKLSEHLNVRTNGTAVPQRRDKKVQQELVKKAGLRSVRQAGGTELEDVQEFLDTEPMPIVVKPVESAGSDGVKLCHTKEEATEHFKLLMHAQQRYGSDGAAVLCQEFLRGKEYVIDHVSVDGEHKTVMLWMYDKRPCNGAAFVYHGMVPVASDSKEAKVLIPYIRGVLDALQIKNGPTHGEAIWTENGPCLVEMNCRACGGEGSWVPLARALTGGYSQVDVGVDSFLDLENFKKIPERPPSPFKAHGQVVYLVSFTEGKVTGTPGYDKIRTMSSLVHLEATVTVGSKIDRTTDLFTNVGSLVVMNASASALKNDISAMWEMQTDCTLFDIEDRALVLKRPRGDSNPKRERADSNKLGVPAGRVRAMSENRDDLVEPVRKVSEFAASQVVVIVDPVSTGGCVAFEAFKRGFKVIAMWSNEVGDMKSHVPFSCADLVYHAELDEEASVEACGISVKKAAGDCKVMAVIVGAESGVPLADGLSEYLGLRTNGTQIPQRRDKKLQQELTKKAGLRSVRQAGGKLLSDVKEFLASEQMPVVVKPVESAGSDGVKLCKTKAEAEEHFNLLMNSQQKIGSQGAAVLCQEFLRGKEYVVDHVSIDGVHKTVMVWVYDKRAVNGAAFVYHGMIPVRSDSAEAKVMIPYVRGVLDALQIKNGPTHGEVMMTPDGPCLVEMNCRSHGGDGTWTPLASALVGGYSQVTATVDAFLETEKFNMLPDRPPAPFKAAGQEVMLVSFTKGKVLGTPGLDRIKAMPSFVFLESSCVVGTEIDYTVDLFTNVGSVILMHKTASVLEKDIKEIREMEQDCSIFELETSPVVLSRPRAESETKKTCEEIVADDASWSNNCAVM